MKYKNIKINFTKIEREGRIGTSRMKISSDIAWDFYNAYEKSDQIFDLIMWTLKPKEKFTSKNPDLQVMLYKFMLENPQKEFEIKVEAEDKFWIYHDIAHSQKDVEDFNVHIFAENEEERLKETVDLMKEDISTELKKEIETEYFKSFGIMKKLFLLLTTFTIISCSTEEAQTQRVDECYNSQEEVYQINLHEKYHGTRYAAINGEQSFPHIIAGEDYLTILFKNGEVRTYCKATQMMGGGLNDSTNNLRVGLNKFITSCGFVVVVAIKD